MHCIHIVLNGECALIILNWVKLFCVSCHDDRIAQLYFLKGLLILIKIGGGLKY